MALRYDNEENSVVDSASFKDTPDSYQEIVPETIGESIINFVCKTDNKPIKSNMAALKNWAGKYPFDTVNGVKGIWKDKLIVELVKKNISKEFFDTISGYDVASPISYENGFLILSGCKAHFCNTARYLVIVDINEQKMWAFASFLNPKMEIRKTECFSTRKGTIAWPDYLWRKLESEAELINPFAQGGCKAKNS